VQRHAAQALACLASNNNDNKEAINKAGALTPLTKLAESSNTGVKAQAKDALRWLR
jgi:hypothetical protein